MSGWICNFTTVGATFLELLTSDGQTAAIVASAVAAAINGDATLAAAGITATAIGNEVSTNGSITSSGVDDLGLSDFLNGGPPPAVAALSPGLIALLGAALVGSAGLHRRRAKRTD